MEAVDVLSKLAVPLILQESLRLPFQSTEWIKLRQPYNRTGFKISTDDPCFRCHAPQGNGLNNRMGEICCSLRG
ncbi:hypothetical protein SD78_3568 [Bacillus badius]|nr:hypothetical protein SD78_3568 [Bacillus badius]